ncbi:MAG: methyltransferase domain-containing protein [Deltaproteobacteria bacterium]|nr:methyltransferase domain-containing protein [Deltaproteobacteria bacterium]
MEICRICNNANDNKTFIVPEMMFGFRDEFEYLECGQCGCVQLLEIPEDLSKYYPDDYYSFRRPDTLHPGTLSPLEAFLTRTRSAYKLGGKKLPGMLIPKIYRASRNFRWEWFRERNVTPESAILDVGCGTGNILISMHNHGFSNLSGIDPYIKEDIQYKNIIICKIMLKQLVNQYDFIMLHHSFEHMADPLDVFRELHRLLKPGRYVLMRIPVASSYAWRKYNVNWVQLDAPRHLFLHTIKSIQILADKTGFQVADIQFDSNEFQFWGSEQYAMKIPLRDGRSYAENPNNAIFSEEQIRSFKEKASMLNESHDGDQACFFLYKTDTY